MSFEPRTTRDGRPMYLLDFEEQETLVTICNQVAEIAKMRDKATLADRALFVEIKGNERSFVADMAERYQRYGENLTVSDKQWDWLLAIGKKVGVHT